MDARIIEEFHDKADYGKVYKAGSIVAFPTARFNELKALGLIDGVNDAKSATKPVVEQARRGRKSKQND